MHDHDAVRSVEVLGVRVDAVTVGRLHRVIEAAVRHRSKTTILNVNAHCLNLAYRDIRLRENLRLADVVFCDGYGVMLASRMLGRGLPQRITYADWLPKLCDFSASRGFSLFFLGAAPGVAREAASRLEARFHMLDISGVHHGYFDPRSIQNEVILEEINAADPDILLVGMGMPLQEEWVMENRRRLNARVVLTGGAVFDHASGRSRRGPRILTENGFEWLARLLLEPRRLWRRYILGNPLFILRVLRQIMRERRSQDRSP